MDGIARNPDGFIFIPSGFNGIALDGFLNFLQKVLDNSVSDGMSYSQARLSARPQAQVVVSDFDQSGVRDISVSDGFALSNKISALESEIRLLRSFFNAEISSLLASFQSVLYAVISQLLQTFSSKTAAGVFCWGFFDVPF